MSGSPVERAPARRLGTRHLDAATPAATPADAADRPPGPGETDALAALTRRLETYLARGDLTRATALGEDFAPLLTRHDALGALAHLARGELSAALGDPAAALAHFRAAGERDPDADPDWLPWRSGAALALLRTGDGRGAAELARVEVELATASGSARALAAALRALAAVDVGAGRVQVLLRARAVLADQPPDRLSTQIATDLAGLMLLTHDPSAQPKALELLREAEQEAVRQELWPLHARVRRLLERLGEAPRLVESEALAALTASELRVARLAAEGLTNKQIAAELVVTVKAVEWHLSHVYRKLDISSRNDLPTTLGAA